MKSVSCVIMRCGASSPNLCSSPGNRDTVYKDCTSMIATIHTTLGIIEDLRVVVVRYAMLKC